MSPKGFNTSTPRTKNHIPRKQRPSVIRECQILSLPKVSAPIRHLSNQLDYIREVCGPVTISSASRVNGITDGLLAAFYSDINQRIASDGITAEEYVQCGRSNFYRKCLGLLEQQMPATSTICLPPRNQWPEPPAPEDVQVTEMDNGHILINHGLWFFCTDDLTDAMGKKITTSIPYCDFSLTLKLGAGVASGHPAVTDLLFKIMNDNSMPADRVSESTFKRFMRRHFDVSIECILAKLRELRPDFKGISLASCKRSEALLNQCDSFAIHNGYAFLEL